MALPVCDLALVYPYPMKDVKPVACGFPWAHMSCSFANMVEQPGAAPRDTSDPKTSLPGSTLGAALLLFLCGKFVPRKAFLWECIQRVGLSVLHLICVRTLSAHSRW